MNVFPIAAATAMLAVSLSAQSIPVRMLECEGNGCEGIWTFKGEPSRDPNAAVKLAGYARWLSGADSDLEARRFDAGGVVIFRKDKSGATAGATTLYTGALRGNRIDGEFTRQWPGHWTKPVTGRWSAAFDGVPAGPVASSPGAPPRLDLNGVWSRATVSTSTHAYISLTFQLRSNGDDVTIAVLGHNDAGPDGTVIFKGRYAGTLLLQGQIQINPSAGWASSKIIIGSDPNIIRVTFGSDPNARTDFERVTPVTPTCDEQNSSRTSAKDAFERGRQFLDRTGDMIASSCWFHIAAIQGDARAQGALANLLMGSDGFGVPGYKAVAFGWAQKSAEQGDYFGEMALSTVYRYGVGTAADPVKARDWLAKANAQAQKMQLAGLWNEADAQGLSPMTLLGDGLGFFLNLFSPDTSPEHQYELEQDRRERRQRNNACRWSGDFC